jgi:hypothetical protein
MSRHAVRAAHLTKEYADVPQCSARDETSKIGRV